jgi:DNA-binding CsgD family transcriptional regulator
MFPSIDAPVIPTEGKEALTAREIEIVRLTVADLEVKQIADRLGISVRTVEAHRAHIFQKLGTRSIARLTKYAIANGLTTL